MQMVNSTAQMTGANTGLDLTFAEVIFASSARQDNAGARATYGRLRGVASVRRDASAAVCAAFLSRR